MKNFRVFSLLAVLSIFLLVVPAIGAAEYSYVDIVNMLTDTERLAVLPADGEICAQWSSYDRRSRYDAEKDKYIHWDANGDGDGYGGVSDKRTKDGRLIMAEIDGPGVIWRIWSATTKKGNVSIYLDGSDVPAVDLPFEGYFNHENEPFTRKTLVHIAAQGKNCYVPISFGKSCKVVGDRDYGQYYEFVYSKFPAGTKVETFSRDLTDEQSAALDMADMLLSNCDAGMFAKGKKYSVTEILTAGESTELLSLSGSGAINSLQVKIDVPADLQAQRDMLRELVLEIRWDWQNEAAVWVPLGDFFGTAPGVNLYKSLPLGMTVDGFYCNWFMPYSDGATISVINDGAVDREIFLEVSASALDRPASDYGRFHAKWHRDAFLPQEPERWIDWTILKTKGQGRFCGVELNIWNPRGGWWGEGDEKFHVDGEKFPSTFGTGSEDYFGYAWCDWNLFTNCYHNQTISNYNKGHISVNRWHIVDNIPFQKSFDGYIEKYYGNDRPTQYSATAYWYLDSRGEDAYGPVSLSERRDYYTPLTFPLNLAGIVVLESPDGAVEAQGMGSFKQSKWRDGEQLWWTAERPGRELKILVDIKSTGNYELKTRLTKAVDYGIVSFALDGKALAGEYDLYHKDGVTSTDEIVIASSNLEAGQHVLTVKMLGQNPQAVGPYMFGMDYLDIVKK